MDEVTDATFADEVLASPVPVIVDFWAPWCKPCEAIEPHLRGIAAEWEGRVRLVRLNVDENLAVPSRYGALALPTVILFGEGQAQVTVTGAHRRRRYKDAFRGYLDWQPGTKLSYGLRANRARGLRDEFLGRIQRALGYRPNPEAFLDLPHTDRLQRALMARLSEARPERTWPESERASVFWDLQERAGSLGPEHESYMTCFRDWEDLGALRVSSRSLLASAEMFWEQENEQLCLLTENAQDGLFLDYTDPDQTRGDDEFELYCWGAFSLETTGP